ncbi:unnamed protein product [Caenorhabditis sp. 36 PRJEB53466]|nr:unnamed protein product [Caenorhabditis sp. 36 PRJEB53466]
MAESKKKENDMLGRFFKSCVAQSNYYVTRTSEMYFMAKHHVLVDLTEQIIDNYEEHKGTTTGLAVRDNTYMTFYEWLESKEFTKSVGDKYKFGNPYVIGSAYTPLRRDTSAVDVVVGVTSDSSELITVPEEALNIFVRAFCNKFIADKRDEVVQKEKIICYERLDFRLTVRLAICKIPPFAVRLTAAMNQYDDFLDHFSPLVFYIQQWFKKVRVLAKGTEKLAVPEPHTINLLIIYFLQLYELVPRFFLSVQGSTNGSNLQHFAFDDVAKYKMAAYEPSLHRLFSEFKKQRRNREPSVGEILLMFFFHYGYLVDLPNTMLSALNSETGPKMVPNVIALSICDTDRHHGAEVVDAFRLQYLFRDAFSLIKDTHNPCTVTERLMNLNVDEAFNAVRDRIMRNDEFGSKTLKIALRNIPEYWQNVNNQRQLPKVDKFEVLLCGANKHYKLDPSVPGKGKKLLKTSTPFTDKAHRLGSLWQKPKIVINKDAPPAPLNYMIEKASRMFVTIVLPNPNNRGTLNVIFRPPQNPSLRFVPLDDALLEPFFSDLPPPQTPSRPFFSMLVSNACQKEIEEEERAKRIWRESKLLHENMNAEWARLETALMYERLAKLKAPPYSASNGNAAPQKGKVPVNIGANSILKPVKDGYVLVPKSGTAQAGSAVQAIPPGQPFDPVEAILSQPLTAENFLSQAASVVKAAADAQKAAAYAQKVAADAQKAASGSTQSTAISSQQPNSLSTSEGVMAPNNEAIGKIDLLNVLKSSGIKLDESPFMNKQPPVEYEPDISSGIVRIDKFNEHLEDMKKSFLAKLTAKIHPDLEYYPLNHIEP